jgi:hypothetical protein
MGGFTAHSTNRQRQFDVATTILTYGGFLIMANTKTNKNNNKRTNKYYSSTLEWRDFEFFVCDEKQKDEVIQMLIEREFLLPSKMPNEAVLKSNAQTFANQLADRITRSSRAKHFGLTTLADNVMKFSKHANKADLFYYMAYLYGSVYWRVPYNIQRLPVAPDAMEIYVDTFAETLAVCLNNFDEADNTEGDSDKESEAENDED